MIWIAINPISSVVHPVISGRDLDRDPTWGLPPLPAQLLSNSDERSNLGSSAPSSPTPLKLRRARPSPPVCLQYKQLRLTRRCIFCSVWPPFFPVSCYFGIGCPRNGLRRHSCRRMQGFYLSRPLINPGEPETGAITSNLRWHTS
jgi:hypothetical protein